VIVVRRVRDIGIIALALAVVFALPYACMVHCLLLHHTDHHMPHCTMTEMATPLPRLATQTPYVRAIPFTSPALHTGVLFGILALMGQTLPTHIRVGVVYLHGIVLLPLTPPPR
jgi:hypothetical protein